MMGASFHDGPDAITVERTACVRSAVSPIVGDASKGARAGNAISLSSN